ncbi:MULTISPECIES: hypothetical protein [Nocardia]|uniref:hypothetical protein n=1 Tax=Nocardia TaxID=1817 RepID=UPI00031A3AA7|nr:MULTISPECIES: hypothetical protein [Nocardia]
MSAYDDWFTHTATIPAAARAQVNADLHEYMATVRECARTHLGDAATVCVSGSLARGEPAIRRRGDEFGLSSDVDLVAVVDDPDRDALWVEKFLSALREQRPDVESTVFTVARENLSRVAGRFGADLAHAAFAPLAGRAAAGVALPRIGRREGLEGLVHELARIYCPDSAPAATPWHTKTALEALRALSTRDRPGPQRYSTLPDDPALAGLVDRDRTTALVTAREHTTPLPITATEVYQLVLAAACRVFGVATGEHELIEALHHPPAAMHVLDGFQRAVLAATILIYGPPALRRPAAAGLHLTAAAIDRDTLLTAHPSHQALTRLSPMDFAHGIEHPNTVVRLHLQGIRRDYYHWLGAHNFGAPVENYRGPAPRGEGDHG